MLVRFLHKYSYFISFLSVRQVLFAENFTFSRHRVAVHYCSADVVYVAIFRGIRQDLCGDAIKSVPND